MSLSLLIFSNKFLAVNISKYYYDLVFGLSHQRMVWWQFVANVITALVIMLFSMRENIRNYVWVRSGEKPCCKFYLKQARH